MARSEPVPIFGAETRTVGTMMAGPIGATPPPFIPPRDVLY